MKDFVVDGDHPCFDGHFESQKILPAVAQISMCESYITDEWNVGSVQFMSGKFRAPIGPGDPLKIQAVKRSDDKAVVSIIGAKGICSKIEFKLTD